MKRVTVFCGSNPGKKEIYKEQATVLGKILVKNDIELVYGGSNLGIMGVVADSVLNEGGKVTGVLPKFLMRKEISHEKLTELILVETMHERKAKMNDLSDGVIALPGGFGTMDELFEMLTWAQLGLHKKPIGLLNIDGFYDGLNVFIKNMIESGFVRLEHQDLLIIDNDSDKLIELMLGYTPPPLEKILYNENI